MQLNVGDIVEGKASRIENYGVFVDLGEGKSGLVHITEIAHTYVKEITSFVNVGDTVKVKVINIAEDGKIRLSIKQAQPKPERRQPAAPSKPDNSYTWTPRKTEPESFEEMMNRFKQSSDEKFSDLKRKNPEVRRSKRGANAGMK